MQDVPRAPRPLRRPILTAALLAAVTCAACSEQTAAPPGNGDPDGGDPVPIGGCDGGGTVCGPARTCCTAGEECVGGLGCLPACASGVRCGAALICCAAGETCVDAQRCEMVDPCAGAPRCGSVCCLQDQVCLESRCVTPQGTCDGPEDCANDLVCEPTLSVCLPRSAGAGCQFRPSAGLFTPVVEWRWTGLARTPALGNVLMTPVVGDIDGDGSPEVAFNAYEDEVAARPVVLNGEDGSERAVGAANLQTRRSAHMALANLDADRELEIVTAMQPEGIVALDLVGAELRVKWVADRDSLGASFNAVAPAIGDLDADGSPEIVVGLVVLSATGQILADRGGGGSPSVQNPDGGFREWGTLLADVDGDGRLDILTGRGAFRYAPEARDGLRQIWLDQAATDGFLAIGDFDDDRVPDLVVVSNGRVRVVGARDGRLMFGPRDLPGGGLGGAPTVADFDQDGRPEFAAAGQGRYTVFDFDCVGSPAPAGCASDGVRWSRDTQDLSSSFTGSSVFDFEGDGRAEVVYNDECFLHVYDGRSGNVLLEAPNTSRTAGEYPVIADVDGDGKAELVVAANDDGVAEACREATRGVLVLGDGKDFWVRTRPIWNQHSYHVTNIGTDGTVPRQETPSWALDLPGERRYNAYRQNVEISGDVLDAPDLKIREARVDVARCPATLGLTATVVNDGTLGVPAGVTLAAWARGAAETVPLGTLTVMQALLPGDSVVVSGDLAAPVGFTEAFVVHVVIDDDGLGTGSRAECHEDNNAYDVTGVVCHEG